ncbi:MAG: glycosyltransferase [Pseudomonadota bacterium]
MTDPSGPDPSLVSVVAIGRNEGARLVACLASLTDQVDTVVYVDSGSTDQSVDHARAAGVEVVLLDMTQPFTAARARNAGYARLRELDPHGAYVQFIDGDCELDAAWLAAGTAVLDKAADVAVVCGRRRERYPEATFWNGLIDAEWDGAVGEVLDCGGDALMRRAALDAMGGYDPRLIAGEEPELCYRMRHAGWRIFRLDAEMTRHDAAMTRFSQWWRRARRGGHAYAEGVALYGKTPERYRVRNLASALFWGLTLPLAVVLSAIFLSPWALVLMLLWPLKIWRMTRRGMPTARAAMILLGKCAETAGILGYWSSRLFQRRMTLIEYK